MTGSSVQPFPASFAEAPNVCTPVGGATAADSPLVRLNERGFEILAGLTVEQVPAITAMSGQAHIKDGFSPGDASSRFANVESTASWLAGGRSIFLLMQEGELMGYDWTGPKTTPEVPGGQTTMAGRLGEAVVGKGLAPDFAAVSVALSARLYGARHFWSEQWESNMASVKTCQKIGLEIVAKVAQTRETTQGEIQDTRVFMSLPEPTLRRMQEVC